MHKILNDPEELYGKGRMFNHMILSPGNSIGEHTHEGDNEIFYFLKGSGLYNDNGTSVRVYPGDTAVCSSGEFHSLANDGYEWNEDMTAVTLSIKDAAKWCDGSDVTGADVVRTFDIGVEIGNATGTGFQAYIDKIEADGKHVTITAAVNDEGKPVNPLKVLDFLTGTPIAQAAWIDAVVDELHRRAPR